MDKKISFIGLGAMGGPMATNIIKVRRMNGGLYTLGISKQQK